VPKRGTPESADLISGRITRCRKKSIIARGAKVRSPSGYVTNVVRFCPREGCRDCALLTIEETIEFEALDALSPFDDSGNIAWVFEGEPTSCHEKRWLELYVKRGL
jgi:hypothetical protein